MLTPEQYEAVGRLSLAFNELEYAIELYTAFLISTPEWSVSEKLAGQGTFRHKAERFKDILEAIGQEHPILFPRTEELTGLVKQAQALAKERNRYVHALVVHDFQHNTTHLRGRRGDFECNETEVIFLASSADALSFQIANEGSALHEALVDLRAIADEGG